MCGRLPDWIGLFSSFSIVVVSHLVSSMTVVKQTGIEDPIQANVV